MFCVVQIHSSHESVHETFENRFRRIFTNNIDRRSDRTNRHALRRRNFSFVQEIEQIETASRQQKRFVPKSKTSLARRSQKAIFKENGRQQSTLFNSTFGCDSRLSRTRTETRFTTRISAQRSHRRRT